MKRVADALGFTPMALYTHVKNKHDLLELIAGRYLAELDLAEDEPAWDRRLARLFCSFHDATVRHPVLAHVLAHQTVDAPAAHAWAELVLEILRTHGFDNETALNLFWILASYTVGFTLTSGRTGVDSAEITERIARLRDGAAIHPNISAIAAAYANAPAPGVYELGLELLLSGARQLHHGA